MNRDSIEDLYARWQRNPSAAETTALCEALRSAARPDLVDVVGSHASRQTDVGALLAAARMYADSARLDDAQTLLLAAGRIDPRNADVYLWLGEVLLRRGDAERAEKVLEKALQLGAENEARELLERARSLAPSVVADPDEDVATTVRRNYDVRAAIEAAVGRDLRVDLPNSYKGQTRANEVHPETRSSGANAAAASSASFGEIHPLSPEAASRPAVSSGPAQIPEPRDVLDALQTAGIYEPEGGQQVHAWTKPEGVRRLFSVITLIGLAVVLVGAGVGTHSYVKSQRAKAHVQAEQLLANVDRDLQASDAKRLDSVEQMISKSFELESRSKHAALTWLHERALVGLLKGGADLAFEDSVQRARAVGIEERNVAFAHVASFLFQGDTAGSAATVAKWDALAQDDPWFQLLAGATFERAGDARAIDRYGVAVKLAPELVIAQVLLTRAMAVDGDPRRAAELAKELRVRYPDRTEGAALVVLAWTRDPVRGDPPAEIKDVTERDDSLPIALKSVPHAARALLALHRGAVDEARPLLRKGLEVADTPGIAAWLGSIALVMGDEDVARKAALTAVSFSAVYPPARVLAARVALLGGRLDEALKATEDLPSSSPDVAIVTAAVSYEKLDGARMAGALEAISDEAKKAPAAIPLVRGQSLLSGNLTGMTSEKVIDMADDEAPWADLVAMDSALDIGNIELAKKIADQWRAEPRAMWAVRLARFARYSGKLEDADKYSRIALESGTVTMRALTERVFTLVAMKKDAEALALFKSYPNVGGPLAKWLRAYATAAHGKLEDARAIVSQEDPPPTAAPMPSRIIAASAYAMMKDPRHGSEYTKPIVQAGFVNPDVSFAAEKLGMAKIARRK